MPDDREASMVDTLVLTAACLPIGIAAVIVFSGAARYAQSKI
jgi:hypothetical protein